VSGPWGHGRFCHGSQRRAREKELAAIAEKQEAERRERIAVRNEIHSTTALINEISRRLRNDQESESLWHSQQLALESRELCEREYMVMAGLEDLDEC
jgi:hypothetical protein